MEQHQGLSGFWSGLESFMDTLTHYVAKFGPIVAAVVSVIPVVGPAMSAGVLVAVVASKMYNKYKKGQSLTGISDFGAAPVNWKLKLETDLKALAIYNHFRKERGLSIWGGTWRELKKKRLEEFEKDASKTKRRMYRDRVKYWEALLSLGFKQVRGAGRSTIQRKLPGYPKFTDLTFRGGVDFDLWEKIIKSRAFVNYAKDVKKNLPLPRYNEFWALVDKKGSRWVSAYYKDAVEEMVDGLWAYGLKMYMLKYMKGNIERNMTKPARTIGKWWKAWIKAGKKRKELVKVRRAAPPMITVKKARKKRRRRKKKKGGLFRLSF